MKRLSPGGQIAQKARTLLDWHPKFDVNETIRKTVEWYKQSQDNNAHELCAQQIRDYMGLVHVNE